MCVSPLFEKCERHFPQCASESSQLRQYNRLKFSLKMYFFSFDTSFSRNIHQIPIQTNKSIKNWKKNHIKIEVRKIILHCEAVVAGFWKSLSSATIAFHPTLNPTYQAEMIWMVCWSSINLFKKIQSC